MRVPELGAGHRRTRSNGTVWHGRLCADTLSPAVPSRLRGPGQGGRARQGGGIRRLGRAHQGQEQRLPQRRAAPDSGLDDDRAYHPANLGVPAQRLQHLDGRGRQPAALHRLHRDDRGREPRGAQPTGHRRRVRLDGPSHGPAEAAGLPGEPGEGRVQAEAGRHAPRRRRLRLPQPQLRR